jgi:transposase
VVNSNIEEMKVYNLHIRKKIMLIKNKEKLSIREVAKRFGMSPNTIFKWGKKIKPKIERKKRVTQIDMEKLEEDIRKSPDAYQYERAQRLKVSQTAVHFGLNRLGVTYKKNAKASESERKKAYYISRANI